MKLSSSYEKAKELKIYKETLKDAVHKRNK